MVLPMPMPIPVLRRGRLTLRPHTMADLDAVVQRCVDPQTVRWTTVPQPYTAEQGREYLATVSEPSPHQISWAIERDGVYAGTIDLRSWQCEEGSGAGHVGFVTHPAARGLGVMSQAMGLVVDHAFDQLRWELLVWQANVGNYGSYKAVWRNGFPLPVAVPALLHHRGRMRDGWHAVLERGAPREPVVPWPQAYAALERQVALARRPG